MSLGRRFEWLWAAYAASAAGTWLAFDAFPIIAIRVLHAGPAQVAALSAAGLAAGALLAAPLGLWVERRRKRPVMMAMDLTRFAALASVPIAFALGRLGLVQLMAVSVAVGAADIAFKAASGAFLKGLVPSQDLLAANSRLEATTWTATTLGPPLGGLAISLLGPVAKVVANTASFLLSAGGLLAIGEGEPPPARPAAEVGLGDLLEGWRGLWTDPALRGLFLNSVLVNGLIMATAPLMAVLMLGRLGFAPWQYGLAFGAPCLGGVVGARLSRPLAERFGSSRAMRWAGALRVAWPVGLALVGPGVLGLAWVFGLQFCLVACIGAFNPMMASLRLQRIPAERLARTLTAWAVSSAASIAVLTALWGLLGAAAGPRAAVAAAGLLLLVTPLLLPRRG